ncbi:MAG: ribulose-phosphate 3-epimerase [Truepera sp.]|nr:ribulose-phosphate 3-epimerase [Truepera sp.]
MAVAIAPSILAADFARLGEQIREAEVAGADLLHVDVMDGRFVPNITLGPLVVEACRRSTALSLDVHLMVEDPGRYLEAFAAAGADGLTVHAEATQHLHSSLVAVRRAGLRVGLAVNPLTPLEVVCDALPLLDLALVMSVNPGFGGQTFIPTTLGRLERVRTWRDRLNPDCRIEVDGGIVPANAAAVARAGADILVAGSAIFGGEGSIAENLDSFRDGLRSI